MFFGHPMADIIARGMVLSCVALVWVIVLVRIVGLRSLSKMTPFDFVMTVALGSLVAGAAQADTWLKFAQPLSAMAGLFVAQWIAATLRRKSGRFQDLIQNEPLLLMRDGKILDEAMRQSRVTKSDLVAKLREANVLDYSDVRAVVLESTGDVSVLHGAKLDENLIEDVRRAP